MKSHNKEGVYIDLNCNMYIVEYHFITHYKVTTNNLRVNYIEATQLYYFLSTFIYLGEL